MRRRLGWRRVRVYSKENDRIFGIKGATYHPDEGTVLYVNGVVNMMEILLERISNTNYTPDVLAALVSEELCAHELAHAMTTRMIEICGFSVDQRDKLVSGDLLPKELLMMELTDLRSYIDEMVGNSLQEAYLMNKAQEYGINLSPRNYNYFEELATKLQELDMDYETYMRRLKFAERFTKAMQEKKNAGDTSLPTITDHAAKQDIDSVNNKLRYGSEILPIKKVIRILEIVRESVDIIEPEFMIPDGIDLDF